jgi:hypothetical protein
MNQTGMIAEASCRIGDQVKTSPSNRFGGRTSYNVGAGSPFPRFWKGLAHLLSRLVRAATKEH